MAYTLDFRSHRSPEMTLTMNDEQGTIIHVTVPSKKLVEEYKANLPELQKALGGQDAEASRLVYHIGAQLISCNLDAIQVTGPELLTKYRLNLTDMAEFFILYMQFIENIEKN